MSYSQNWGAEEPLGANAANELSYSAGETCLCGDCLLGSSHGHMTQDRQAGEGFAVARPCGWGLKVR